VGDERCPQSRLYGTSESKEWLLTLHNRHSHPYKGIVGQGRMTGGCSIGILRVAQLWP
jgi:hypothetical protein